MQTAQKTVESPAVDVPVLFSDNIQQSKVYVLKVPQIHFVDEFLGKVVVPVVVRRQMRV